MSESTASFFFFFSPPLTDFSPYLSHDASQFAHNFLFVFWLGCLNVSADVILKKFNIKQKFKSWWNNRIWLTWGFFARIRRVDQIEDQARKNWVHHEIQGTPTECDVVGFDRYLVRIERIVVLIPIKRQVRRVGNRDQIPDIVRYVVHCGDLFRFKISKIVCKGLLVM
jgi:hypothetical protein